MHLLAILNEILRGQSKGDLLHRDSLKSIKGAITAKARQRAERITLAIRTLSISVKNNTQKTIK